MTRSSINLLTPTDADRAKIDLWERTRTDPTKKIEAYTNKFDPLYQTRGLDPNGLNTEKTKKEFYERVDIRNLNMRQPFLDLLVLPKEDRPSTFDECLKLFYPLSSDRFIGTNVGAYHMEFAKRNQTTTLQTSIFGHTQTRTEQVTSPELTNTTIPEELGDMSMFYGWFLVYRLLLCPKTFRRAFNQRRVSEIFIADPNTSTREIRSAELVSAGAQNLDASREYLSNLRSTANLAKKITSAILENAELLEQGTEALKGLEAGDLLRSVQDTEVFKDLMIRGMSYLSEKLAKTYGIPKSATNAIASYSLQGKVSENAIRDLFSAGDDKISQEALRSVKDFTQMNLEDIAKSEGLSLDLDEFPFLKDDILKFEMNPTANKLNALLPSIKDTKLRSFLEKRVAATKKLRDIDQTVLFKRAADALSRKNPQTLNGLPLLLVGVGVNLTFNAVDSYLQNKIRQTNAIEKNIVEYFKATSFSIDPTLGEEGFTFGFDDFSHTGVKDIPRSTIGNDQDWVVNGAPYCSPVQGADIAKYWECIFEIYTNIINQFRNQSDRNLKRILADLSTKYSPSPSRQNVTYSELFEEKGKVRWTCETYKIFVENAVRSTQTILEYLPRHTAFTHYFGFQPTFLIRGSESDVERRKVWGTAQTSSVPDILVSGSADNGGWLFTTSRKNGYFSPGAQYTWASPRNLKDDRKNASPHSGWTIADVQNYKRPDLDGGSNADGSFRKTINSQRRLDASENAFGFYGNRTSLSFDVTNKIPIFNAQWNAMISVLLCYPEALNTLANNGYDWASTLKPKVPNSKVPNVSNKSKVPKAADQTFAGGVAVEVDDDEEAMPKKSTLSATIFATTTTAAALGAATYVYHKKNPRKLSSLTQTQKIGLGAAATTLVASVGIATHFLLKK